MNKQALVATRIEIDLDAYARYYGTTEARTDVREYFRRWAELTLSDTLRHLIDAGVIRVGSA